MRNGLSLLWATVLPPTQGDARVIEESGAG